jgi:HSP20 family protein
MVHFRFPIRQLPVSLQDFATDVESIVEQVFNQGDCKGGKCEPSESTSAFRPAFDIYEADQQFDLYMDLPGVKPESVKLEMHEDRLLVSGVKPALEKGEGVSAHRVERTSGPFSRSIQMPKQLDSEKIEADFDNGVLHVVFPKLAKPSPRTIEIKTSVA